MTIYKDLKIGSSVNGTSQRYTYNVTSSVSSLSGADANGNTLAYDSGFADVYLNGVRLSGADITITSGNAVSFASNLSNGDVVDIVAYGAFAVASINADNISSGFAGAAFVVYLSSLTSIKFTATQYALFSSIMLFIPKLIAGYSGSWVSVMGYSKFFIVTALLGVPVLLLIIWIAKVAPIKVDTG